MAVRVDRASTADVPYLPESTLSNILGSGAMAADAALIVVTSLLSRVVYEWATGIRVDQSVYLGAALLLAVIFTLLIRSRGGYDVENLFSLDRQIRSAGLCWAIGIAFAVAVGFLLKASADLSRGAAVLFLMSGLATLILRRIAWRLWLTRAMAKGALKTKQAILIGSGDFHPDATQFQALNRAGIDIVQSTALPVEANARKVALEYIVSSLRRRSVDEVIVSLPAHQLDELDEIAEHLRLTPLPLRLMPDQRLSRLARQRVRGIGAFALIDIVRAPLGGGELAAKRALDVAVASLALVAVAPLLVLAFVAIRLDTAGPVLFRQSRQGFNGRMFKILKLRTMTAMDDGEGSVVQATRRDPRVTRVGAWLRRTSIDELPQLWNVLRGEMSIVGPRPHAVAHDNYYDALIENYAFRHHVKPGLTGWAQVNGLRGETPDVSLMAARVEHDVWYISNWSILLDFRILLRTVTRLFSASAF